MAASRRQQMTKEEIEAVDPNNLNIGRVVNEGIESDIPKGIILKLLGFTAAMFILPLVSFYTLLNPVFKGNSGYAGGFAALVANLVLGAYIYVAFQDDKKERAEEEADRKKKAQ